MNPWKSAKTPGTPWKPFEPIETPTNPRKSKTLRTSRKRLELIETPKNPWKSPENPWHLLKWTPEFGWRMAGNPLEPLRIPKNPEWRRGKPVAPVTASTAAHLHTPFFLYHRIFRLQGLAAQWHIGNAVPTIILLWQVDITWPVSSCVSFSTLVPFSSRNKELGEVARGRGPTKKPLPLPPPASFLPPTFFIIHSLASQEKGEVVSPSDAGSSKFK